MWTILRFPRSHTASASAFLGMATFAVLSSSSLAVARADASETTKAALSPSEFRAFPVSKVETLSPNTKRITFALPGEDYAMGVATASLLVAKATINGKTVIRPYTPTNLNDETGFLELVVKGYPTGLLSKHIVELKEGDVLEMKGPYVKFKYEPNKYKKMGLLAGGSGITPMLQLIKTACRDPSDHTEIVLLFANQSEEDILLRQELDALMYLYPQFKVKYIVDKPSETWTGLSGYVTKEMIQELMPAPSDDHFICVCGPPPMMYHISGDKAKDKSQGELQGLLKELHYTSTQVFKY